MILQNLNFLSLTFKKFNIPQDIISSYLWPLLSFPHMGRIENDTIQNNSKKKCILMLPKLTVFAGPKVIYNIESKIPKIKFIYCIYHSKKQKHRYITIHETFNIQFNENMIKKPKSHQYWHNFTSNLRKIYYENINRPCEDKRSVSILL